jgi:hypothetical protein
MHWLGLGCAVASVVAVALAIRAWMRFEDVVDQGSLFLSFGSLQNARDDLDLALAASLVLWLALIGCSAVVLFQALRDKTGPWRLGRWALLVFAGQVFIRIGALWTDGSTAREIRRGYVCITLSAAILAGAAVVFVFVLRNVTNATTQPGRAMSSPRFTS